MAGQQCSSMDTKAAMAKYIKEMDSSAEKKGVDQDKISITTGFMFNAHKVENTELHIIDQHHWSGKLDPEWPFLKVLPWKPLDVPPFKHQGPLPTGSVAGIVYVESHDSTARKWLLAFDTVNFRVHVEAGPAGSVDWGKIKQKLDQSGRESEYADRVLGGRAFALYSTKSDNLFSFFLN
ncbi:uncharacterized protein LOC141646272 [Silene latifolia]|uniref:uncharacterized protein LOC141646272 n=1 Tax=Silene latifolia TaxID=37657 RepID=UPI003D778D4B